MQVFPYLLLISKFNFGKSSFLNRGQFKKDWQLKFHLNQDRLSLSSSIIRTNYLQFSFSHQKKFFSFGFFISLPSISGAAKSHKAKESYLRSTPTQPWMVFLHPMINGSPFLSPQYHSHNRNHDHSHNCCRYSKPSRNSHHHSQPLFITFHQYHHQRLHYSRLPKNKNPTKKGTFSRRHSLLLLPLLVSMTCRR